jgi:phosphatidylserine decarboxylase
MFIEKSGPEKLVSTGRQRPCYIFQKERIEFAGDLIRNLTRTDAVTRYSEGLGRSLVETDVKVRSTIGYRKEENHAL